MGILVLIVYILSVPLFGIAINVFIFYNFQSDDLFTIILSVFIFYFTNFRLTNWKFFQSTHFERLSWICLNSFLRKSPSTFFLYMGISEYLATKKIIQKKIRDDNVKSELLEIISNPEFISYFKTHFKEHVYYKNYLNSVQHKEYLFNKIGTEILAIVLKENHEGLLKDKIREIIFRDGLL